MKPVTAFARGTMSRPITHNRLLQSVLWLVLASVLSGCVKLRMTIDVKPNGSGAVGVAWGLTQQAKALAVGEAADPLKALADMFSDTPANPQDVKVTRWTEGEYEWVQGEFAFADLIELNERMSHVKSFEYFSITRQPGVFRDRFVLNARLASLAPDADTSDELGMDFLNPLAPFEFQFAVRLPGTVLETNGVLDGEDSSNMLWSLSSDQTVIMQATSATWNWLNIGIVGGAVVLCIVAIGGITYLANAAISGPKRKPSNPSQGIDTPVSPAPSAKRTHAPVEWVVVGVLGAIVLVVLAVGAIAVGVFLKSTPSPAVSVSPIASGGSPTPTSGIAITLTRPSLTSTPRAIVSCQQLAQNYLDAIHPLLFEFADTAQVAGSTPRIALGPVIQDLQRIRRDLVVAKPPACAQGARGLIVNGMDSISNAFIAFMGDTSNLLAERRLRQGMLDLSNGTNQLIALAAGRATPVPEWLPTDTPVSTPLPSPTPLPAGSPLVIGSHDGSLWQIKVTKVLVADTLKATFSDRLEKAAGRFAIVFMEVTNRGLSQDTFIAFGTLDIKDASGQRYEENSLVSFIAQDIYRADICANINPDQTKSCVSVYDISRESDFYALVPGTLADPYAPRLLVEVP